MAAITITIFNSSTVLTDAQVEAAVPALQKQVHRDVAPAWGVDADLTFVGKLTDPPLDTWWVGIFDTSDQADALGYHDLTAAGLPFAKVFAKSDIDSGSSWTVTISHEVVEMLVDPDVNLAAFVPTAAVSARLFAYEACDACEADQFGYDIDGTIVSDFVFPAWFESFRGQGSTQFDQQGKIGAPFQLLVGGYISVYDVSSGSGWQQLNAQVASRARLERPRVGSRRERRRTDRAQWLRSTPLRRQPAPNAAAMIPITETAAT